MHELEQITQTGCLMVHEPTHNLMEQCPVGPTLKELALTLQAHPTNRNRKDLEHACIVFRQAQRARIKEAVEATQPKQPTLPDTLIVNGITYQRKED